MKDVRYVWVLWNTSIGSTPDIDCRYVYAIYDTLEGAIKRKKECIKWQKTYCDEQRLKDLRRRVYIKRMRLYD